MLFNLTDDPQLYGLEMSLGNIFMMACFNQIKIYLIQKINYITVNT